MLHDAPSSGVPAVRQTDAARAAQTPHENAQAPVDCRRACESPKCQKLSGCPSQIEMVDDDGVATQVRKSPVHQRDASDKCCRGKVVKDNQPQFVGQGWQRRQRRQKRPAKCVNNEASHD